MGRRTRRRVQEAALADTNVPEDPPQIKEIKEEGTDMALPTSEPLDQGVSNGQLNQPLLQADTQSGKKRKKPSTIKEYLGLDGQYVDVPPAPVLDPAVLGVGGGPGPPPPPIATVTAMPGAIKEEDIKSEDVKSEQAVENVTDQPQPKKKRKKKKKAGALVMPDSDLLDTGDAVVNGPTSMSSPAGTATLFAALSAPMAPLTGDDQSANGDYEHTPSLSGHLPASVTATRSGTDVYDFDEEDSTSSASRSLNSSLTSLHSIRDATKPSPPKKKAKGKKVKAEGQPLDQSVQLQAADMAIVMQPQPADLGVQQLQGHLQLADGQQPQQHALLSQGMLLPPPGTPPSQIVSLDQASTWSQLQQQAPAPSSQSTAPTMPSAPSSADSFTAVNTQYYMSPTKRPVATAQDIERTSTELQQESAMMPPSQQQQPLHITSTTPESHNPLALQTMFSPSGSVVSQTSSLSLPQNVMLSPLSCLSTSSGDSLGLGGPGIPLCSPHSSASNVSGGSSKSKSPSMPKTKDSQQVTENVMKLLRAARIAMGKEAPGTDYTDIELLDKLRGTTRVEEKGTGKKKSKKSKSKKGGEQAGNAANSQQQPGQEPGCTQPLAYPANTTDNTAGGDGVHYPPNVNVLEAGAEPGPESTPSETPSSVQTMVEAVQASASTVKEIIHGAGNVGSDGKPKKKRKRKKPKTPEATVTAAQGEVPANDQDMGLANINLPTHYPPLQTMTAQQQEQIHNQQQQTVQLAEQQHQQQKAQLQEQQHQQQSAQLAKQQHQQQSAQLAEQQHQQQSVQLVEQQHQQQSAQLAEQQHQQQQEALHLVPSSMPVLPIAQNLDLSTLSAIPAEARVTDISQNVEEGGASLQAQSHLASAMLATTLENLSGTVNTSNMQSALGHTLTPLPACPCTRCPSQPRPWWTSSPSLPTPRPISSSGSSPPALWSAALWPVALWPAAERGKAPLQRSWGSRVMRRWIPTPCSPVSMLGWPCPSPHHPPPSPVPPLHCPVISPGSLCPLCRILQGQCSPAPVMGCSAHPWLPTIRCHQPLEQ